MPLLARLGQVLYFPTMVDPAPSGALFPGSSCQYRFSYNNVEYRTIDFIGIDLVPEKGYGSK